MACGACAASLVFAPATHAAYPDHPVRVVLPYPAGGPTDTAARLVAAELTTQLGQSFYVDNRAGAGTAPHLEMEAMKAATGINVVHVPYKGSAPGLADLMAGTVQLCFDSVIVWQQYRATGKLKALAVTGAQRSTVAPDIPTMAQAGYPQLEATVWYGLAAPAGTPPAIVKLLNDRIGAILAEPAIVQRLHALGSDPLVKTPEKFRSFLDGEVASWGKIVKQAGASVD